MCCISHVETTPLPLTSAAAYWLLSKDSRCRVYRLTSAASNAVIALWFDGVGVNVGVGVVVLVGVTAEHAPRRTAKEFERSVATKSCMPSPLKSPIATP